MPLPTEPTDPNSPCPFPFLGATSHRGTSLALASPFPFLLLRQNLLGRAIGVLNHPPEICWEVAFKGKEVSKPQAQWLVLSCLLGLLCFLAFGFEVFWALKACPC